MDSFSLSLCLGFRTVGKSRFITQWCGTAKQSASRRDEALGRAEPGGTGTKQFSNTQERVSESHHNIVRVTKHQQQQAAGRQLALRPSPGFSSELNTQRPTPHRHSGTFHNPPNKTPQTLHPVSHGSVSNPHHVRLEQPKSFKVTPSRAMCVRSARGQDTAGSSFLRRHLSALDIPLACSNVKHRYSS